MDEHTVVSVDFCLLIPCYNNREGLIISINSIIYPPKRCVVLVVDDGSDCPLNTDEIYKRLCVTANVVVLRLEQNAGITNALNAGLQFIEAHFDTRFIARLDCGDTCYPGRFFRQVSFLEEHPAIDLVGAWCYFKDPVSGTAYKFVTPTQHYSIKYSMYFRNVFVHPTVMWRTSSMPGLRYPLYYPHAEDYGLFYDVVSRRKTAIIDEFLVTCEINPEGISSQNRTAQLKSRLKVIWHFGEEKAWVAAGSCKLILLMAIPKSLLNKLKKQLYKARPSTFLE